MQHRSNDKHPNSRRKFLKQLSWAPVLFLPSSIRNPLVRPTSIGSAQPAFPAFDHFKFHPHYPSKTPLDDIMRFATPGTDEYLVEGYVAEIEPLLHNWSKGLRSPSQRTASLSNRLDLEIQASPPSRFSETVLRAQNPIYVIRRDFSSETLSGKNNFLEEMETYLKPLKEIETADFEIYSCSKVSDSPLTLDTKVRYEFVGTRADLAREERIGSWRIRFARNPSGAWKILKWSADFENVSRAAEPMFLDITSESLGNTASYREQLSHGSDYWQTVLDGAIGVDVYGNNGLAVGDFNNDGYDDLYVCQPAGLPNRLYRNRGDGTFEDVTEQSGLGVLDFTACALFADFQNRGMQDLLVVCATGPLLFANDGRGKFTLKRDAFRFSGPPQGAFTHAAAADYDHDGRLDVYFCLYNYYQGLDQYRYPVPYFDARNGPPNYLFHNAGDGVFEDRTEAAGLNAENDRYSFACCWGDINGNGWPDLYVVNDFGRNNLYRNNGDGTFTAMSDQAHVDEAGAGMSACWTDFDNDGKQDIYAAGMWVAAGMRVFEDTQFHPGEPQSVRDLYRRHMSGNSLYRNLGDGGFQNVAPSAGVDMGRWSWSADSWDFDHDGHADLYIANGYISGIEWQDVSSFFWRQVVAKSPSDATPSPGYERGWGAINELIRSGSRWNGYERNVFLANNRDGTFSDVSGVVGLDFRDDSRAFALADLDGDGRCELILKNRTGPQIRILHLAAENVGNSISFCLRGEKSNRDAIGAAVTVEAGSLRQTKYLQAGSGFLSQHTKELFFGLATAQGPVQASIRWPSGVTQNFDSLPVNHRIEIVEGAARVRISAVVKLPVARQQSAKLPQGETIPASTDTWLIEPVKAPEFSLPDLDGNLRSLRSLLGRFLLLNLWTTKSNLAREQLRELATTASRMSSLGLAVAAMNLDDASDLKELNAIATQEKLRFPILLADADTAALYNILYRYMFSRHTDLPLPTSLLLDENGSIFKVYRGSFTADKFLQDMTAVPKTAQDRLRKALPFRGTLVQDAFKRNSFTYGVAFFQHGFLKQAAESFKQVIEEKPEDAEAYYNLGTVYLRSNSLPEARQYLEQAVKLRQNYPEAWNNLGMIAAQQGDDETAIARFQHSLQLRPSYATALLNLGNVYRRKGNLEEAQKMFQSALAAEPENPEVNYALGMTYARQDRKEEARQYLEKAIQLRPDYADALNNLGVLFIQTRQYTEAEREFEACIQQAPDFDQAYLNLARLHVFLNEKEKARSDLQKLLQKQPQHKIAQQMLQMLY